MKRYSVVLSLLLTMVMILSACSGNSNSSGGSGDGGKGKVGLAMPTKSSERWVNDGNNMKKEFEKLGYTTDLQYAEDVVENQVSQIENMITKGAKAIVIASIDGEALTDVLQKAHDANVKVIAYDRLIKKANTSTIMQPSIISRWVCCRAPTLKRSLA